VVQKALQVTNGIKFLEIIELIKKTIKSLKQTNYGKKIYDNLMANYGDYFNQNQPQTSKNKNKKGQKKTVNNTNK
jgi:hypothetical protein